MMSLFPIMIDYQSSLKLKVPTLLTEALPVQASDSKLMTKKSSLFLDKNTAIACHGQTTGYLHTVYTGFETKELKGRNAHIQSKQYWIK